MLKAALVALMLLFAATACDAPWAGPSLPSGATHLNYTFAGRGPVCPIAPDVVAFTNLAEIRTAAAERCNRPHACTDPADECWPTVSEQPGNLYVAVLTADECNRPVKEDIAAGDRAVYFIHWIGRAQAVCNMAMAIPGYRLFLIPRSELPSSGAIKVELQVQDEVNGTSYVDTEVALG